MDGQTDGLLIQRALRQFSPDVFLHPVWIRFAASSRKLPAEQILPLMQAEKEMLAEHDLPGACAILFLCAARQSWLNDYSGALDTINQVLKLGKRHHLPDVIMWSHWGASAICTQQGDFQRAAQNLRSLHAILRTGDWILAGLVELIAQALERMTVSETGARASAGMPQLTNPFLQPIVSALFHWGMAPHNVYTPLVLAAATIPPARSDGLRQLWQRVLRWVRGSSQPGMRLPALVDGPAQIIPPDPLVPVSGGKPAFNASMVSTMLTVPASVKEGAREIPHEANGDSLPESPSEMENGSSGQAGPFHPLLAAPAVMMPTPQLLSSRSPDNAVRLPAKPAPAAPSGPSLALYFFGSFRLYQNDQLVAEWPSQKSLAILKYLAANRRKPVTKDVLMEYFWADAETEVARRNLHQAIYALRQVLKRGWPNFPSILFENDCYLINPQVELWLDFEAFDHHIQAAQRLEEAGSIPQAVTEYGIAQELYPGDFLEDDLYEDWPNAQRTYYRTIYMDLLNRLCEHYIQQQQYYPAIILCQKVLAKDNCAEQAYRNLIQCYLAQGQRQLAIRAYQTCVQTLKQELNLAPSKETRALYTLITTQGGANAKV